MTIAIQNVTDICLTLAHRFKDPIWIRQVSLQKENFMPYLQTYPWDISTLSHGYPGFIILFSEMNDCFPDQGWDLVAHRYLMELIQEIEKSGVHNSSLFSGLAGICFAIHLASKENTRYQTLLTQLNVILIKNIEVEYLLSIEETKRAAQPLSSFQYDVITGISGVFGYVLEYVHIEAMQALAQRMVRALVLLKEPILQEGIELPGWYTPVNYLIREEQRAQYQQGSFDTGVAHGVAGCLAVLSKAYLKEIAVENQVETIQKMAFWLKENQIEGKKWPAKFRFNAKSKNYLEVTTDFYRDGWCYGAPGIASSLFLAAKALQNDSLKKEAIQIMKAVCERFDSQQNLECVSFCHGLAGLLTHVHAFYLETHLDIFSDTSKQITQLILKRYDPVLPFGYKCFASLPKGYETIFIDNAGFLDGVIGTLLSLLFSNSYKNQNWIKLFLIN